MMTTQVNKILETENDDPFVIRDENYYISLRFGHSYVVLYSRRDTLGALMTKTWDGNYTFDFSRMKVYGRVQTDEPNPTVERLRDLIAAQGNAVIAESTEEVVNRLLQA